ncbi:MAG TPA: Hpt domain-containing protein [Azospirillaceae bacterium]|nr:Hpt domain-containing protein [Azospirillaceae bacterium]
MTDPDARLRELRRRFLEDLPGRVEALAANLSALRAGDAGAAVRAATAAHALAGAAGVFDEPRLREAAIALEDSLRDGADTATLDTLQADLSAAAQIATTRPSYEPD